MFNKLWDAITNARFGRKNRRNVRLLHAQVSQAMSKTAIVTEERSERDWAKKEAEIKAKMEKQRLQEQRRTSRNIVISIIAIAIFEVGLFNVGTYVGKLNAPQMVREVIKTETVEDTSKLEALKEQNARDIDELNRKHADEMDRLKADYETRLAAANPPEPVEDTPYVKGNKLYYDEKVLGLPDWIANCNPIFISLIHVPASKMYSTGIDTIELHSNKADFSIDVIRDAIYKVRTRE